MRNVLYRLSDRLSRAWNRFVLVPGLKSTFRRCGANVTFGRRFEVAGVENISIGHDVYLGPGATLLSTRAEIQVGDYVMSGPNLTIITGDHRIDVLERPMMSISDDEKLPENDQDVVIGNDVWLGSGVTILKGVAIADHCVIAAGAVVTKDVGPEYSIWGGVPARMISMRPGACGLQKSGETDA